MSLCSLINKFTESPNARIYGSEPLGSIEKDEFCYLCRRMFLVMVSPFEKLKGVINVVSGYTGGHTENPTYEEVCSGTSGHFEAVQITFDPNRTSYDEILDIFWQQTDPTDSGGQFNDRGQSH